MPGSSTAHRRSTPARPTVSSSAPVLSPNPAPSPKPASAPATDADATALPAALAELGDADLEGLPESEARVRECLDSASYWSVALPRYANRMQNAADVWAYVAGILAIVTGLAVWTTVADSTSIWAQAAVTVVALMTGICALVPRVRNYAEMAGAARELAPRIQHSYGLLCNLWARKDLFSSPIAHKVVKEYEDLIVDKARLRYVREQPSAPTSRDEFGIATWTSQQTAA